MSKPQQPIKNVNVAEKKSPLTKPQNAAPSQKTSKSPSGSPKQEIKAPINRKI